MDPVDRSILNLLLEDGRRSVLQIAQAVRLSAPAVRRRMDRLASRGVLRGFTAVVDYGALGWQTEAFVEISLPLTASKDQLAAVLRSLPEAIGAWAVSGDADVLVHLRTRDNAHLEEVIQLLRGRGVAERTRSHIVLTGVLGVGTAPVPVHARDEASATPPD